METMTCPTHNVELQERRGQFGTFWACPEYRTKGCRYTYDPKKERKPLDPPSFAKTQGSSLSNEPTQQKSSPANPQVEKMIELLAAIEEHLSNLNRRMDDYLNR